MTDFDITMPDQELLNKEAAVAAETSSGGDMESEEEENIVPVISEIAPVDQQPIEEPKEEEIFKPKRAGRPRKGELTEKQAEHLKRAREKGLIVRREKALQRKKEKEEDELELNLIKKNKDKEAVKKKYNLKEIETETEVKMSPTSILNSLSKEELKELQQSAIMGYDEVRKERKKKKKILLQKEKVEEKTFQTISHAVNTQANQVAHDPYAAYDSCFSFS